MKSIISKIFFGLGIVLLLCFFIGLVLITYDYNKNAMHSYGSTPVSVYYIIHAILFLPISIVCFTIGTLLHLKTKQ